MPTSGALDRVAEKLNLPFFEVLYCIIIVTGKDLYHTYTPCEKEKKDFVKNNLSFYIIALFFFFFSATI